MISYSSTYYLRQYDEHYIPGRAFLTLRSLCSRLSSRVDLSLQGTERHIQEGAFHSKPAANPIPDINP
jgi:hypothetical protein